MTTASKGTHVFPSELGWMVVAWSGESLTRLSFGHPSAAAAIASLETDDEWTTTNGNTVPAWIRQLAERLQSYAAGSDERFDDVPLDLSHLSEFQHRVVRACRRISRGRVRISGAWRSSVWNGRPWAVRWLVLFAC